MLSAIRTTTLRVLMFAACWGGAVPAFGTVYVSNEGDNTTGCSWETALYSLSAAVTLASPGESVVVAKGTYLIGGAISVPSDAKIIGGYNGDEVVGNFDLPPQNRTVLDGGNTAGSIFACSGATGVVIQGFTLTGCKGGGTGYSKSGAIRCDTSADVTIRYCRFELNKISGYGGGINIVGANADISDCVFSKNKAEEGGGVKVHSGTTTIVRCKFLGNEANLIGGAFSAYDSDTEIVDSVFLDNKGPYGGAIECHEGTRAEFSNCLVAGNQAEEQGAGLSFTYQAGIKVAFCTIADNSTPGIGGGVFMHDSTGSVTSCIVANNGSYGIFENDDSADPVVTTCLFNGNTNGAYFNEGSQSIANASGPNSMNTILAESVSNLDGDPLFSDPTADDYHVRPGSAAINAAASTNAPGHDLDGDVRPIDPTSKTVNLYDIGSDEYSPYAFLTVLKPMEHARLKRGKTYEIAWINFSYTGSSVKIELRRKGEIKRVIATSTPNAGSFLWNVPTSLPARKGYSIRVTSVNIPAFSDDSDGTFKIVDPN